MKKIIYCIVILAVLFILGCQGIDVNKLSDEDLSRLSEKAIVCNKPYMRFGMSCCLDQNNNNICDDDEKSKVELEKPTTITIPSTTLPKTTTTIIKSTTTTIPTKSKYTLADYPNMFINNDKWNAIIAMSDEAPAEIAVAVADITSSLQFALFDKTGKKLEIGATKLLSEIIGGQPQNIILVGTPCNNWFIANLLHIDTSSKCDGDKYILWDDSRGYIQLFEYDGIYYLVVTGKRPADVRATGNVLANYRDYILKEDLMMVDTATGIIKTPDEWAKSPPSSGNVGSNEPIATE